MKSTRTFLGHSANSETNKQTKASQKPYTSLRCCKTGRMTILNQP